MEQRWVSELAQFNFELRYCLGKENANADGLSRQYLQAEGPGVLQTVQPVKATLSTGLGGNHTVSGNTMAVLSSFPVYSIDFLVSQEQVDPVFKAFLKYWRRGQKPSWAEHMQENSETVELLRQWYKITEETRVVYRELLHSRLGCLKQLLLPCSLCAVVLRHMHDGHGHQGVQRTLQLVHARCYWLGMYSDIQEYYRQMRALHRGKSPAATGSYRIGESVGVLTTEGAGHGFYSLRPIQQWA